MHAAGPLLLAGTQPALGRAARAGSCGAWLSPLPSSKRRRRTGVGLRSRPWGSADGLTEKRTHGVQPGRPASRRRGGGGTEAAVAWGCRAPSRRALDVQNESPPRVGRPGTPRGLTARGLQQRAGPTAPRTPTGLPKTQGSLCGSLDHHRQHPKSQPARENALRTRTCAPRPLKHNPVCPAFPGGATGDGGLGTTSR